MKLSFLIAILGSLLFHNISTESGLPPENIFSIVQDKDGNMWFGNDYSASRFDGYNVTNFNLGGPFIDVNNRNEPRLGIYSDQRGNIWASYEYLYTFDFNSESFNIVEGIKKDDSYDFVDIGDICLLASGREIIALDPDRLCVIDTPPALLGLIARKFYKSGDYLYISTNKNDLYRYDITYGSLIFLTHVDIVSSVTDLYVGESLWIASAGDGLFEYSLDGKVLKLYKHDISNPASVCSDYLRSIAPDGNGNLWIATGDGLAILDLNSRDFKSITCDRRNSSGLSHNSQSVVFFDRDGVMWLGAALRGVDYCYPKECPFKTINLGNYAETIISALAEDVDGSIWIGTTRLGAFHYYPESGKCVRVAISESESVVNDVMSISIDSLSSRVYFGTARNGMYYYNKKSGRVYSVGSNPYNKKSINAMLDLQGTNLYLVSSPSCLLLYNKINGLFREIPGTEFIGTHPRGLFQDKNSNIVIATLEGRVYKCRIEGMESQNPTVVDTTSFKLPGGIYSAWMDDNCLRIASSVGLYIYQNGECKTITKENGLSSNFIRGVEIDFNDNLWISTDFGLNRVDAKTGDVSAYFKENGLPDNEFRYRSCLRASNGMMYFGGNGGLCRFNPSEVDLPEQSYVPRVSYAVIGGERQSCSSDSPLIIKPGDGAITLYFAVPNFLSFGKDRFFYRLSPDDTKFIAAPSNFITYPNLKHGKYCFELSSESAYGRKSDGIYSIQIIVLPHWYESLAAKILYVVVALTAIAVAAYLLRKRLKKKYLERAEKIRKATEEDLKNNRVRFYSNRLLNHEETDFLNRAITVAETHIKDKGYSIEDYASDMCMSRSNLHLRLISTTSLSASHFLNKVRIEKAIQLLNAGKYSVSSVGEMTGFASTSYFVKIFRAYTGSTPGKIAKNSK